MRVGVHYHVYLEVVFGVIAVHTAFLWTGIVFNNNNNNNDNNNNNRLFPICLQISCFDHLYFLIPVSENGMSLNLAVIF